MLVFNSGYYSRNPLLGHFGAFAAMTRLACLLFGFMLAGCGGPRLSPVEGVVLLDGKPLADAAVQFVPQSAGRDATGQTDAAGKFVMSTKNPRDGVHPGAYKVVISPPTGSADSATYGSADEAMAAASKRAPSKPSGPTFPQKYARADLTPLTQEVPVKGKVTFELKK
jgi:hypothetical protein